MSVFSNPISAKSFPGSYRPLSTSSSKSHHWGLWALPFVHHQFLDLLPAVRIIILSSMRRSWNQEATVIWTVIPILLEIFLLLVVAHLVITSIFILIHFHLLLGIYIIIIFLLLFLYISIIIWTSVKHLILRFPLLYDFLSAVTWRRFHCQQVYNYFTITCWFQRLMSITSNPVFWFIIFYYLLFHL